MSALSRRHRAAAELRRLEPDRPAGRKTARVVHDRREPYELPDWVLTFPVPTAYAFAVSVGQASGVSGVTILPGPIVEARGKNWEWVYRQAATYLAIIGKGGETHVTASVTRAPVPGIAPSAPSSERIHGTQQIILVSRPCVVFPRAMKSPLIIPV